MSNVLSKIENESFSGQKKIKQNWKHQIVASTVPETQLVPCWKALIVGPSDTISFSL